MVFFDDFVEMEVKLLIIRDFIGIKVFIYISGNNNRLCAIFRNILKFKDD